MSIKKRPFYNRIISIVMIMLMVISMIPMQAFADSSEPAGPIPEWTFDMTTEYKNSKFKVSSEDIDIFHLEGLVPGDSFPGKITLNNKVKFTEIELAILSITNDNENDSDLFDALQLEIWQGDELIYEGSYGATPNPISDYIKVKSKGSVTFDVLVSLPETAGNEIIGKEMSSTWTFEARYYTGDGGGGGSESEDKIPYQVHYVDESGNKLLDSKTGYAKEGETVTEYAPDIKGYTPDAQSKSIVMKDKDNVITFVYYKQIATGVDLTEGNTGSGMWLMTAGMSILAASVILFNIQSEKRRDKAINKPAKGGESSR